MNLLPIGVIFDNGVMTVKRTLLLSTTSASLKIIVSAARLRTSLVGPAQMLAMLALDDLS
jgi:hypothetical protein